MKSTGSMPIGAIAAAAMLLAGCAALAPPPVWEQPPPPVKTGSIVDASRLHRTTLENGMHVILFRDPRLPLVSYGVALRRGQASLPAAQAGLARFTSELLERGAGERDALGLAQTVDRLGARLASGADWDSMEVGISGLSRDSDTLLGILADVVLRPRFEADEAAKVRAEQLASLEQSKDEPRTLASWSFAKALYGEHPFGSPLQGTPASVAGFGAADARALHASVFVASNAVFYASGDIDPEALLPKLRAHLGDWQAGEVPAAGPPAPAPAPAARRVVIVDRPELQQVQIVLGHEGITRSDPRRIAAGLLDTVVGSGGFSSRLMSVVRGEQGLTYSVYGAFSLRREGGPFFVSTFTRVEEALRTIELLLSVLSEARTRPPTAEELRHAQSYRVGSYSLALETSAAVTEGLVGLDVQGLPEDSLDTYRDRVGAVTQAETAELARTLLHPERAAIVVVGPAATLRETLASLGPVEVVTP